MIKMDKLLLRILGILLGLYIAKPSFIECVPIDNPEAYYKHLMFKANEQFESMLDNWAADYARALTSDSPPVICPAANATSDNGDLLSCIIPAVNNENINFSSIIDNLNNQVGLEPRFELPPATDTPQGLKSIQLNETLVKQFYERMRWFIDDPVSLTDQVKLKNLPNFIVMYGSMKNVTVAGISKFQLTDINVNTSESSLMNKFLWPHLNVSGLYEMDLSGPRVHLYGDGPFSFNLSDVSFGFDFKLGENENKTLRLDSLDIDMNIGNISVRLDNFLDGSAAGDTANAFLSEILPEALSFAMPQLKETLQKKLLQHMNTYLNSNVYSYNITHFIDHYIAMG